MIATKQRAALSVAFLLLVLRGMLLGSILRQRGVSPIDGGLSDRGLEPNALEAPGLHNVYRLDEKLLSGSSPEGELGFRSLQDLGVRTVLSVDGARPDVELARKYGLRYVHLPIGYDGITREQALRLSRAI